MKNLLFPVNLSYILIMNIFAVLKSSDFNFFIQSKTESVATLRFVHALYKMYVL